ncbi:MAG: hypothetical protein BGO31_04365 [Bacteroidetes bacterium 43-16]|nr:MAG: hypothetical protein BGO31_04365 [Bacteroidetes bacterium 43-16]
MFDFSKIRAFILERKALKFLFFGNYFYGFCAVGMALETYSTLDVGIDYALLLLLLISVITFYTHAYRFAHLGFDGSLSKQQFYYQRNLWYYINYKKLKWLQLFNAVALCFLSYELFIHPVPISWSARDYTLLIITLLAGLCYIGAGKFSGRNVRAGKNVIIAWVWAGMTTALPIAGHELDADKWLPFLLLFVENFLFVLVLSIVFDIKDYVLDATNGLATIPTKLGFKKTLKRTIIPLCVVLFFVHLADLFIVDDLNIGWKALSFIPFLFLLALPRLLKRRQSLLFYLFIIDGMMLFKGLLGFIVHTY